MSLEDIHTSDTGIQAFDVTPHAQPEAQVSQPEAQVSQPLNGFTTPTPPAPQPQPQPQPQLQPQPQPQPQLQPQPQQASDAYQAIIAQQQTQIDALIAQTNAQSAQIAQMVQNGAQFTQSGNDYESRFQYAQNFAPVQTAPQQFPNYYDPASPMQQFNPPSLATDTDYSLEALAKEIGKKMTCEGDGK